MCPYGNKNQILQIVVVIISLQIFIPFGARGCGSDCTFPVITAVATTVDADVSGREDINLFFIPTFLIILTI